MNRFDPRKNKKKRIIVKTFFYFPSTMVCIGCYSRTKEEKLFPAAALPNQYVAAYTKYTPEEMSMLPVDTITKW